MYEDFFAKRLSQLRTLKKVSAREMSLAIGQNASYINVIENKKSYPSMQGFFYICEYLDITPEEFFNMDVGNPLKTDEVYNEIRKLSPERLALVISLVRELNGKK